MGEAAVDSLGDDRAAGDDPVSFQQLFRGGESAHSRVGFGEGEQRPAPGSARRSGLRGQGRSGASAVRTHAGDGAGPGRSAQVGAQWGERVIGDEATPDQAPERVEKFAVIRAPHHPGQLPEEIGAASGQGREDFALEQGSPVSSGFGQRERRGLRQMQAHPAVVAGQRALT